MEVEVGAFAAGKIQSEGCQSSRTGSGKKVGGFRLSDVKCG